MLCCVTIILITRLIAIKSFNRYVPLTVIASPFYRPTPNHLAPRCTVYCIYHCTPLTGRNSWGPAEAPKFQNFKIHSKIKTIVQSNET